jgi:hypothetical protein
MNSVKQHGMWWIIVWQEFWHTSPALLGMPNSIIVISDYSSKPPINDFMTEL